MHLRDVIGSVYRQGSRFRIVVYRPGVEVTESSDRTALVVDPDFFQQAFAGWPSCNIARQVSH